jgi:hypothetical protein
MEENEKFSVLGPQSSVDIIQVTRVADATGRRPSVVD